MSAVADYLSPVPTVVGGRCGARICVLQHHQIPWHWESGARETALYQEINGPQCLLMMVDSMGAH